MQLLIKNVYLTNKVQTIGNVLQTQYRVSDNTVRRQWEMSEKTLWIVEQNLWRPRFTMHMGTNVELNNIDTFSLIHHFLFWFYLKYNNFSQI